MLDEMLKSASVVTVKYDSDRGNESIIKMFEKLYSKNIQKIYPGHGDVLEQGSREIISVSLTNMRRAKAKELSERVCYG